MAKSSITKNIDVTKLKKLQEELKSGAYVKIGILGGMAEKKEGEKGFSMAELGSWHEFGAGRLPERSFLRKTTNNFDRNFSQWLEANKTKITEQLVSKGLYFVLNKMGAWWVARVHDTFDQQGPGWQQLSPDYKAWKETRYPDSKILMMTGALRQSITHEVVE